MKTTTQVDFSTTVDVATQWVREWGEVVNKTRAGLMLGISRRQVNRLIEEGRLKTSFDGRVLVRPAAELYNSKGHERRKTRGYQPAGINDLRFVK